MKGNKIPQPLSENRRVVRAGSWRGMDRSSRSRRVEGFLVGAPASAALRAGALLEAAEDGAAQAPVKAGWYRVIARP